MGVRLKWTLAVVLCAAAGCGGAAPGAAETGEPTAVVVDQQVEWPLALEGVAITLDDRRVHDVRDESAQLPARLGTTAALARGEHRVGVELTVTRPCIPGGPREKLTVRASRTVRIDAPRTPIGILFRGDEDGALDVRIGTGSAADRGTGTVIATTTDGCGLLGDG